jgi:hypothetical protein
VSSIESICTESPESLVEYRRPSILVGIASLVGVCAVAAPARAGDGPSIEIKKVQATDNCDTEATKANVEEKEKSLRACYAKFASKDEPDSKRVVASVGADGRAKISVGPADEKLRACLAEQLTGVNKQDSAKRDGASCKTGIWLEVERDADGEASAEESSKSSKEKDDIERRRRLADELKNKKTILGQLGAVKSEGGSLTDVLANGSGTTSMDEAFAGSSGVTVGSDNEKSGLTASSSRDESSAGKSRTIEIEKVEILSGEVDKKTVRKKLDRYASRFRGCSRRAKKTGTQRLTITASQKGRVTEVGAQKKTTGASAIECLRKSLKRVRFSRSKEGWRARVTFSVEEDS